jgi:hypothetical protein
MKSAQNQKPTTFAEQEKINAIKKHYADVMAGRGQCVGSEPVSKRKTYCHRGAGMSDAPPAAPQKPRSPYADKVWTVVNNSVRKNRWATYYDAGECPVDLLQEDEGSWADRA